LVIAKVQIPIVGESFLSHNEHLIDTVTSLKTNGNLKPHLKFWHLHQQETAAQRSPQPIHGRHHHHHFIIKEKV
jgi:hypothetical protein